MLLASQSVKRLLWKYLLRGSLVAPILLVSSLLAPSAQAVDLQMSGTRTVLSGTDCNIATYRFGTNNVFNGKNLDLLVEVLSEDNDLTGTCITTVPVTGNNILTVDIRDRDATDTVAFMDLKFTVVESGTLIPVEVDRIAISGFDLDSNIDTNSPRRPTYDTGTDDIYIQAPDGVYISNSSLVTYTEGTFIGGAFPTYQTKFKGRTTGNCNDGAGASVDITCRGGAIRINGANGVNKVSTFTLRVQNDDAYGRIPDTDTAAIRRFQLSFEISELEELITANTDYGDAPASYGDASHSISGNIALGYGLPPDHETSTTVPSASANGDDNDGAASVKFDDEEGVSRSGVALNGQSLLAGATTNLDITTFGTGRLSGWLDLNRDGDFIDAGEQIITDRSITSASVLTTAVPISIPGTATAGNSMMRFRFSTATGATPSGASATDGEVEDYAIVIAAAPVTISGTVFDDADGSKLKNGTEVFTNAGGLNAVLVNNSNLVVATTTVAADGTYTFSSVPANANYTVQITTATATVGSAPPAITLPATWVSTGENLNTAIDGTVDSKLSVAVTTSNVTGVNFGIEQLPNTTDLNHASQTNPGGTATVQVPTLAGTDPEDGTLGSGKSFKIVTLPSNGILTYNNTAVTVGQVISSYDPALLKLNPNDGAITVSFTYAAVDAAGQVDSSPATVTMPFSVPKRFALVKRITAINGSTSNLNDPNNSLDDINLLDLVNDGIAASADDEANWPAGYLRGAINAGFIKPGDTVEYTIYFLNADGSAVENVRICDRLLPEQTLLSNVYSAGSDVELQLGTTAVLGLTEQSDASSGIDRAEFIAPSVSVPATCNLLGSNDDGTLLVDVTGPAGTGVPALTSLPGSTGSGAPNDSYGLIRFRTLITP